MATALFFHAHPDDETLFTGGTMARAAAEGHRVVLVTATRGERGANRDGLDAGASASSVPDASAAASAGASASSVPDASAAASAGAAASSVPDASAAASAGAAASEPLGSRRERELRAAAALLGVDRCELLGYVDSGIDGAATDGFTQAPAEQAAERLAAILAAEAADVLVTYDERGIYGHPDHLQVHKVGLRAAQLADTATVYLATVDRDRLQALLGLAQDFGLAIDDATLDWAVLAGVSAERITVTVDVSRFAAAKRDALAAHQTQFPPGTPVLELPPAAFEMVFGTEWFMELGGGEHRAWLWES